MQLDVEIGTTVQSWRLGTDDSLDVWLRRCPWRSGEFSQMRILSLASQNEADRISMEIRRLVYAADEGVYSPKVLISGSDRAAGLIGMLTACIFGEPRSIDRFSLKRLIVDRLKQAPHVFQLIGHSYSGELLEEMQALLEDVNREDNLYPLIVLILSKGIQLIRRPDCFNTAPAMPVGRVLNPRNLEPGALWGSYMHSRAAWECGGDIRLAQIYGSAWKRIPQYDDAALEASCSLLAAERWREISANRKAQWQQYLIGSFRLLEVRGYGETVGELVEEGLLWPAPGQCRLMPTAWAVRATAEHRVGSGALRRAALVNSVLVAEVLSWCFQLEALEREQYDEACDWSGVDESKMLHASFVAKESSSAAFLYPENYPLSLTFKEFETFGGFCRRLGTNSRADARRKLLRLRNALCHGHYAGWKTIEAILLIQARLGLSNRA